MRSVSARQMMYILPSKSGLNLWVSVLGHQHGSRNSLYRAWNKSFRRRIIDSVFLCLLITIGNIVSAERIEFANEWAVELTGGPEVADLLALENGFVNMGKVFPDENVFLFRHNSVQKRSLRPSEEHHAKLFGNKKVLWAEQQRIKRRVKRSVFFDSSKGLTDPLWRKTWYLLPTTYPNMRVTDAWQEGYTGKGVVVTILDDGIEYEHPDLNANYDKLASSDINDHDDDPAPRPTYNNENRHGTRCAGEVAAVANNKYCSAGIAFNAFIGGVRMLDGSVTDSVEAQSIGLRPEHIDVYSASWGPDDDGKTVDGPAKLAKKAFEKGVEMGRDGKGSVFVWASGNGGRKEDNCNCDGYTNSIYTLSISSTTQHMEKPWYSEPCSSTLAATYSSGTNGEKQIITTDLSKRCTESHTGTSASAPLAAGICALALEANRNLTWRDMQHLVVRTANPTKLHATDWVTNGVGRNVSHFYGYGLMDAYAMVKQAQTWVHVPKQRICTITVIRPPQTTTFSSIKPFELSSELSQCDDGSRMPDLLEHVQARLSISNDRRGDLAIYLKSAKGTISTLLDRRRYDYSGRGFNDWPFMTTHNWDEDPKGTWVLEVQDTGSTSTMGSLTSYVLVLHGTYAEDWPAGGGLHQMTSTASAVAKTTASKPTEATKALSASAATLFEVSSTKSKDAAIPATSTEKTAPGNCNKPTASGLQCLVCQNGFVRSPDKHSCMTKCPPGYFPALQRDEDASPEGHKGHANENDWEIEEVLRFEDEERFDGSRVCVPCSTGPFCISCDGPWIRDCTSCIEGFNLVNGGCISVDTIQSKRAYGLTVTICVSSVILFIILFLLLHCRRSKNGNCLPGVRSKSLYRYIPNERDLEEPFEDSPSYDFKEKRYKKNGILNGYQGTKAPQDSHWAQANDNTSEMEVERQLLRASDDESGLFHSNSS